MQLNTAAIMSSFSFYNAFLIGFASTLVSNIPWTVVFLLTQYFGVRLYNLKNKEECQKIQKNLTTWCSHTTDGGKGYGYSFGPWYIASISAQQTDHGQDFTVWLIATAESYKYLTRDTIHQPPPTVEPGTTPPAPTSFTLLERNGSFFNSYFINRTIIMTVKPRPEQVAIIDIIKDHYKKTYHTVAMLHGPPGTGKSMISLFLTDTMKGKYCNTLKPWQPGDSLATLYREADPSETNPLIVAFDEFDSPLIEIHAGIQPHKEIPIHVSNKQGWNMMFDQIDRGVYPFLIVVLTTNKTPEFIRSLDPSYIREGRVNLICEVASHTALKND